MSQKFHITIHPGCPSGSEHPVGGMGLGPFDPGGDDSIGKVDDPGGDDSIGKVDDPGGDDSIGKVDDPNGLAQALIQAAQAYGSGGAAPGSVVVNQGGGCCCAHKDPDFRNGGADSSNLEYSGFVIFRLRASAPLKEAPPLPNSLKEALRQLLTDPPAGGPLRRPSPPPPSLSDLLVSLLNGLPNEDRFFHLEQIAAKTRLPPLHSLLSYHRLDLRHRPELIESALRLLGERPEVDLAYRELAASDPAMTLEGRSADQGYLEDAPQGIGARAVWAHLTSGGPVPTVIDLEQGWNPEHENLSPDLAQLEPWVGSNKAADNPADGHHGTAVLGQLVASQDGADQGVLGLLPDARLELASHYLEDPQSSQALPPSNGHVARAIAGSLMALDIKNFEPRRTILLLEVQRSYLPTEVDPADFDAIRLATALGVTVVEAAGNGGRNLDLYEGVEGGLVLNRKSPNFRESGAILVGAADPLLPHDRLEFSNFGSRIDCFAAGRAVTTLGFGDLSGNESDQRDFYTNTFDGTSSASPIIAGAVALTQTLYIDRTGNSLPPLRIRKLLKDPQTGTPKAREREDSSASCRTSPPCSRKP